MQRVMLAAAVLLVGACAPAAPAREPGPDRPPAAAAPPADTGTCDSSAVADLVGQPAAEVAGAARLRSGARSVRIYATGQPVTMDFRPDRLNIEHDASGRIVRLLCG